MSRTFADDLAADLANTFLNANEFGETVTFVPKHGPARSITVAVQYSGQSREQAHVEILEVLVARDEAATPGGIARPLVGDQIRRSATNDHDASRRPYTFSGEIIEDTPQAWMFRFG